MKEYKTPVVMFMFEEVKEMCQKVDVNPTILVTVRVENINSIVIAYAAPCLEASGKAFDEMGMRVSADH